MKLDESIVEEAALNWFGEMDYSVEQGPKLAPGESASERDSFGDVILVGRLREAIQLSGAKFRRNHQFGDYLCDFYCHESKLVVECDGEVHNTAERQELDRKRDVYLRSQDLNVLRFENVRVLNETESVLEEIASHLPSTSGRGDGGEGLRRWEIVRLIDFDDAAANDWLAVNQFTVVEGQHNRRPDIVVFVNGLPLALIELKNAADEDTTIWSAYYHQFHAVNAGQFQRCHDVLGQTPVQAEPRRSARIAQGRQRRRGLHDDSEVFTP